MATTEILLPVLGASLDATDPPGRGWTTTDGTPYLAFNGTTSAPDEICYWSFRLPTLLDNATAPTLTIQWSNSTTNTNNVVWQCQVSKVAPSSDTDDMTAARTYDTTNKAAADAGVGTRQLQEVVITLTNFDSADAGDKVYLKFFRDPDDAGDTMGEDAYIYSEAVFTYTLV